MQTMPTPQELEILAVKAGISMTQACREAGVSATVFHRWKRGKSTPTLRRIAMLLESLHQAVERRETMEDVP